MTNDLLIIAMERLNEALTAATVIVAISMLLYNLTHGLRDRVVRASSMLLACVSLTYIGDVFIALSKSPSSAEMWLRFQWLGIAFTPAALFHLSHSLLATTGLVSRGRRRRVVRILYLFSLVFFVTAVSSDLIVRDFVDQPMAMLRGGPLLWLYVTFFVGATIVAFNNVLRARRRCQTAATNRRMTYLLLVFLTPAIGIFPYSLLFPNPARTDTLLLWILINVGNLGIVLMLVFMAYPLSFFGSHRPDRVIKSDLLRFVLRGPVTGILVLLVILFVPATRVLGLPGQEFMPFAAVATVLFLQWTFTLIIPILESWWIYPKDRAQVQWIRDFSQRLLTREDSDQLLEATLAAICDYLRVPSAFVASVNSQGAKLEKVIGPLLPSQSWISSPEFLEITSENGISGSENGNQNSIVVSQSFWLIPLHSRHISSNGSTPNGDEPLNGVLGIWARSPQPDLLVEEEMVFSMLLERVARILDSIRLQGELFTTFERVIRETGALQDEADPVRFGNPTVLERSAKASDVTTNDNFVDLIKDALRDWYGGKGLTETQLLGLNIVHQALPENDNNPARAVRAMLTQAIESLKPEGQRSMTATEWTLYNILEMRFVQGRKVRDVAARLAMSEPDLYRKQKIAIIQVAQKVAEMEAQTEQVNKA